MPRWQRVLLTVVFLIGASVVFGPAGFVWLARKGDGQPSRWTANEAQMQEVAFAIVEYRKRHGAYPESMEQLSELFPIGIPRDPWTKEHFIYESDGQTFRLICYGRDLKPGGAEPPDQDIIFTQDGQQAP